MYSLQNGIYVSRICFCFEKYFKILYIKILVLQEYNTLILEILVYV